MARYRHFKRGGGVHTVSLTDGERRRVKRTACSIALARGFAVTVAALSGCSSAHSNPPGSGAPMSSSVVTSGRGIAIGDPCGLVELADVARIAHLNQPITSKQSSATGSGSYIQCVDTGAGGTGYVRVTMARTDRAGFDAQRKTRAAATAGGCMDLPDLGQAAYFCGKSKDHIAVLTNDIEFGLEVHHESGGDADAETFALARFTFDQGGH